ncbi:glucosidase family protein [Kineosporia succinea]|uniref:Prenyltransferase/squalene oxidase-like repeat protein n=1 Tax=Kineosporia succinea TaxID=84632 RepID=A0ABT9PC12_9ACTN|nr:hypothetical protein [Kineosporia succinea]MDP9830041.1 hypothetical protein [Kineosporia succinea]
MDTAAQRPYPPGSRPPFPTGAQIHATALSIAAAQHESGAIPWFPGGGTDPWDHVECLMALDVQGLHEPARAGYDWLRRTQRPDGSWPSRWLDGTVVEATAETNHAAYVAVGVLHHWLSTADDEFLARAWPMVRDALAFTLALANPDGTIGWARSPQGSPDPAALVTGCSSIHQALRCGVSIADALGADDTSRTWEAAADRLQHALLHRPGAFVDKSRFSMDWYYPVLGGALRGDAARERIDRGWDTFVVPGSGIRCVSDRPWVTGAETCELALALASVGDTARAAELVASMQHLRDDDGSYWTGLVLTDGKRWPVEHSTWTGAAMVLAVDLINAGEVTGRVFGDPAGELDDLEDVAS